MLSKASSAVAGANLQFANLKFSGVLHINFDLQMNSCLKTVLSSLHGVMLAARKVQDVDSILITCRQTKKSQIQDV